MTVLLSPVGGVAAQFFDNNGNPLSGGKLFSYAAGTTTPAATYTSSLGTTAHTNPIILDAGGRVPGGEIWLTDGVIYKFVLQTSTNVLIATYDNIVGINSNFVNYTTEQEIQTATAGQTVFNLTTTEYQPGTNSLTVYVDGVNQYGPGAQYAYLETDSNTVTFVSGLHVGASVKFTTATQTTGNATNASVVSYTPPFTGSVTTNVEDKLAQTVSIIDFGASTGAANNTAAITAALAASGYVIVPEGVFDCGANITVPAGKWLVGPGTLNFTTGKLILSNESVIQDLGVEGNGNTNNEDGVSGANAFGWIIRNCRVSDIEFNGIQAAGSSYFTIEGNTINNTGTPAGAILPSNSYLGHGVHIVGAQRGVIRNNDIAASHGQAGIFIDSSATITVSGNYIHDTFWAGIRGYDTATPCTKIVIDSNRFEFIGSLNTTGDAFGCNGIANFNPAPAGYGIWDWVVVNNFLQNIDENGIEGGGFVSGNTIYRTNYRNLALISPEGIYTQGPAKIVNNTVVECDIGILVYNDGTEAAADKGQVEISDNHIVDSAGGSSIIVKSLNAGGAMSGLVVKDNRCQNGGIILQASFGGSYTSTYVMNNILTGSGGVSIDASVTNVFNNSFSPSFASGAGSPEGVVTAIVGSIWTRTDGGATTTLYVKTSGSGNTGWTAK
jgi:parallel beta-helix repeat protein